jgi:hypothetical protein
MISPTLDSPSRSGYGLGPAIMLAVCRCQVVKLRRNTGGGRAEARYMKIHVGKRLGCAPLTCNRRSEIDQPAPCQWGVDDTRSWRSGAKWQLRGQPRVVWSRARLVPQTPGGSMRPEHSHTTTEQMSSQCRASFRCTVCLLLVRLGALIRLTGVNMRAVAKI